MSKTSDSLRADAVGDGEWRGAAWYMPPWVYKRCLGAGEWCYELEEDDGRMLLLFAAEAIERKVR